MAKTKTASGNVAFKAGKMSEDAFETQSSSLASLYCPKVHVLSPSFLIKSSRTPGGGLYSYGKKFAWIAFMA